MKLVSAKVGPFKSISSPQDVSIDPQITVFVGMNEAGKTVFLQALQKSEDALKIAKFDPIQDYPRKNFTAYMKRHGAAADAVAELTYELSDQEATEVNKQVGTALEAGFQISVTHKYDNTISVGCTVDEKNVIANLLTSSSLSSDAANALKGATKIRDIPSMMEKISPSEADQAFVARVKERIGKTQWDNVVGWEVWQVSKARIPKFLYFSEYDLLPSKVNLADLQSRYAQAKANPAQLTAQDRAAIALLRMAEISIEEFTAAGGYEELKAKIESVSISLTDQIMAFWKQNEDLEVEVDIKNDPGDKQPFNNGPNLYLRIKNRRHRGVSTPFDQRSRGFVWFFSFLVWFDSVQHQLAGENAGSVDLILLLDEPGLALHALAQRDFLHYIDDLATRHQVLYTTHSPFMVHSERLYQVRMVEDKVDRGTVITDNVSSSDSRTIFPLQAALGWSIAQNLFISERNLLVEGPSDLIYLKAVSGMLERLGRIALRDDITIVPAGGLDKVVTFIALLGASGLKLAVFHDLHGAPEQSLSDLVKQKMISPKSILNASQFRDLKKVGTTAQASDTEDLFDPALYVDYFNKAYTKELRKAPLDLATLPKGDRIIERIERYLKEQSISVRPSGGFNHYLPASTFASNPPAKPDDDTLERFECLFKAVNEVFAK